MSCIDIIVAAYWGCLQIDPAHPDDPAGDRFVLSKGHAASALYTALAMRGFLDEAELGTIARDGSRLAEHPDRRTPGVEAATGSLGHGLGIGIGMALAARLLEEKRRVVVLMSDGEQNEGSVWEGAMFAARHKLSSLTGIVDFNGWQATGRSRDVLALEPLAAKWRAFAWEVSEVDGHDMTAVVEALNRPPGENPRMIIAHTVKGKGVSFMEDDNNWHYRIPTAEEVVIAHRELGRP
jgi:transketolase